MYRSRRSQLIGFAYLAPALVFVLAFTAYPLVQMVWMSFHNWSLITPPKYVGLANYRRAFTDDQFWVSFAFTLKYTAIITPVLIVGGYLLALLTSQGLRMRRITRTTVFIPVVIGLGVSSSSAEAPARYARVAAATVSRSDESDAIVGNPLSSSSTSIRPWITPTQYLSAPIMWWSCRRTVG